MKQVLIGMSLVGCVIVGYALVRDHNRRNNLPVPVVVKAEPKAAEVKEAPPAGPMSFWSGEIIIGEGPRRGEIELVAAPGEKAVLLRDADKGGAHIFDSIKGMKPGEMYIRLGERGKAPLMSFVHYQGGKETRMHPVYQLSRDVKEGRITPFLVPGIMPLAERKYRQEGQYLEGYTWSIRSYDEQVYGRERAQDSNVRYASTDIEMTPSVKADLVPFERDLTKYYFTEESLVKMAEEDKKFDSENINRENGLIEHQSSVGVFRRVISCERYSINPKAKSRGGWSTSTLQLPNGKWMTDLLGIQQIHEADGQVYLICRHHILRWINNEKIEVVVSFEGVGTKWSPYISAPDDRSKLLAGRYLAVNKSSDSEFGGLLEYGDGKWSFHPYDGDYGSWVEKAEERNGQLALTLVSKRKIQFDPVKKSFEDQ